MNWFRNMKTSVKLVLGYLAICGVLVFVGYEGLVSLKSANQKLDVSYNSSLIGVSSLLEANVSMQAIAGRLRGALLAKNKEEADELMGKVDELFTDMKAKFGDYKARILTDQARQGAAYVEERMPKWEETIRKAMSEIRSGDKVHADEAMVAGREFRREMDAKMDELVGLRKAVAKKQFDEATSDYKEVRTRLLGIIGGATVLALLLGVMIARMIAGPLQQATKVLTAVANRDFTARLSVASTKDEIGLMAIALNQAVTNMQTALKDVRDVAETVAGASQQLASTAEEISSGAQEQASSLEETSANIEQMTATVKQSADNARQANQLADGSRATAEKGGEVVSQAVIAMTEINSSSKQIADIITTIDEIAFQTNLLALNAAVEAARAGEQGRGFAVVASEVRNLAQRSAMSAKEIKGLIQNSVRKVEGGSELVNRSGQNLGEIVASVKRVTDIVAEMAAAAREQATGIDQVNKAITQMDQVTQANAGQTEEMSSTAQALSSQAEQLRALVGQFKLDADGQGAPRAHVAPPPPARKAAPMRRPPARPVHAGPAIARGSQPAIQPPASTGDGHDAAMDAFMSAAGAEGFEQA